MATLSYISPNNSDCLNCSSNKRGLYNEYNKDNIKKPKLDNIIIKIKQSDDKDIYLTQSLYPKISPFIQYCSPLIETNPYDVIDINNEKFKSYYRTWRNCLDNNENKPAEKYFFNNI